VHSLIFMNTGCCQDTPPFSHGESEHPCSFLLLLWLLVFPCICLVNRRDAAFSSHGRQFKLGYHGSKGLIFHSMLLHFLIEFLASLLQLLWREHLEPCENSSGQSTGILVVAIRHWCSCLQKALCSVKNDYCIPVPSLPSPPKHVVVSRLMAYLSASSQDKTCVRKKSIMIHLLVDAEVLQLGYFLLCQLHNCWRELCKAGHMYPKGLIAGALLDFVQHGQLVGGGDGCCHVAVGNPYRPLLRTSES